MAMLNNQMVTMDTTHWIPSSQWVFIAISTTTFRWTHRDSPLSWLLDTLPNNQKNHREYLW